MPEFEPVILEDPASALTATFVPGAGMIGTSLADGGVEYLGQRRGLDAYVTAGKTMGIPILYPWANRLGATTYEAGGRVVTLTSGVDGVRTDPNGAPIHGVLAASPDWAVTSRSGNSLTATLAFDTPAFLSAFPFPHELTQVVTLADRTLTIETTVTPTSDVPVPLCFGYHPYVTIPGVPRQEWELEIPAMRHLPVDDEGLPTGAHDAWAGGTSTLGETSYDDGFDEVPEGAVFTVSGGGRRIAIAFEKGYPAAQLFAPPAENLIAIEPMAAVTDALRRGGYRLAEGPETARFSITVG